MKKSHAQVDCGDAIRIADETLAWIKTQRELEVEKWIQRYMKEDQRGFWASIFNLPSIFPTREEAEKVLRERRSFDESYYRGLPSPYEDIQGYYGNQEALAKRIIKLAQFSANGQITMTDEAIDSLIR
jgi:hypothetical protein